MKNDKGVAHTANIQGVSLRTPWSITIEQQYFQILLHREKIEGPLGLYFKNFCKHT